MKYLKLYEKTEDPIGTKVETPYVGMALDENIPVYASTALGEKVNIVEGGRAGFTPEMANPVITITMQDNYTDTAIIALTANKNEDVEGDIVWSHDLSSDVAKIEGSNLVFTKHYEGALKVTATATNASASKTINVTCDETITATTYALGTISPIADVEASVTSATVNYTDIPTYHYQLKDAVVGDPINMSKVVTFSANTTSEEVTRGDSFTDEYGVLVTWSLKQKGIAVEYLCFEADGTASTISLTNKGSNAPVIYYSKDNKTTWTNWDYSAISLNSGEKVYMYGSNYGIGRSSSIYSYFSMTGKIKASGNIQSLISSGCPETIPCDYCYYFMFQNCTGLTSAEDLALPATTLKSYCYCSMFYGCTGLTTAPALPATALTFRCYEYMFNGCTSLTTAPELPATTLASDCYYQMFGGCTSLTTAPELPATTLANNCYQYMFDDCTSLTTAPELPTKTLAFCCYGGMFQNCTSLTTAPELPATTLASYCYYYMFKNCTNLTTAPELPATTLVSYCYYYMFYGCTGLTRVPNLPATTLDSNCYSYMFYGCTKLNYIKAMFTTEPSTTYTQDWVSSVASTGTFVKNSAATWDVSGVNGIPEGWTVETATA